MQEQRLTLRLRTYWDLLRKNNPIPDMAHFNQASIEDMMPYCFMVAIEEQPRLAYKFNYMGKKLVELYGQDLTGEYAQEQTAHFPGMVIHRKLEGVFRSKIPQIDDGNFLTQNHRLIKYRAVLLPFGKERVNHIIVGLSYRVF